MVQLGVLLQLFQLLLLMGVGGEGGERGGREDGHEHCIRLITSIVADFSFAGFVTGPECS